ncbi:MAG: Helix-turn-helix protein, partial [Actinomycetota bacterium]|nr:Helix-turn-helix protein [Actinomycetota bacterium]
IFVDATDAVDELLSDPELAEESQANRERMREADRVHAMPCHAMTLAMVRNAAGLTQVELAKYLNVSQAAVARTEARDKGAGQA